MAYKLVTFRSLELKLRALIDNLEVLAGNRMGDTSLAHQDRAKLTADIAADISAQLSAASEGKVEPFFTYPSPIEICQEEEYD